MKIEQERYTVTIVDEVIQTLDDLPMADYEIVYNPDACCDELMKLFRIDVTHRPSLIGGILSCVTDCAVLEGNVLTILQNHTITQYALPDVSLLTRRHYHADASWFSLYAIPDGYIVYGEMEVLRLSRDLAVVWSFSGPDIFVYPDGPPAFAIDRQRRRIELYDWDGTYYELDYDGQLLLERNHP